MLSPLNCSQGVRALIRELCYGGIYVPGRVKLHASFHYFCGAGACSLMLELSLSCSETVCGLTLDV